MSKDYLPHKIDPFKSAIHETQLHGTIPITDMQRLLPSLHSSDGRAEINLTFGMDEQKICILSGQVKANILLQCQRCMEPFNYEIMSDFLAGVVKTEEEVEGLPEGYVPIIVNSGFLIIQEVIEDELIVNLPVVPMHEPEKCKVKLPFESGEVIEMNNPFNVISILRSKDKK